jgi:UDP-N-acetylmuramate dehydrogenase
MRFEKNKLLKNLTTLKIGGKAKFFSEVRSEEALKNIIDEAERRSLKWYIIGSGSNIVASDNGFGGLIIKVTIEDFKRNKNKVFVGAGNDLLGFIKKINKLGLRGMEKMAGIPGTVAGAIYGNAGAYGQEICDRLVRVRIFDGKNFRWLSKKECSLQYRDSVFKKHKNWIITAAEFSFKEGNPKELSKTSRDIIKLRLKRYPKGMLCPGSFFKNVIFKNIPRSAQKKIPTDKIMYGKVPAGYLLEVVGAKGLSRGGIKIAKHHANLFYNVGGGQARDIKKLAELLRKKVFNKFGVKLEEEVQYL